MYRFVIVDDEKTFRDELVKYIFDYSKEYDVEIEADAFENGSALLERGFDLYDVLLLDISMPDINGMDVARKIRETNEKLIIIFITTIAQQAINGYEVGAKDFIIKPVSYETFKIRVERILRHVDGGNSEATIKFQEGTVKLKTSDIFFIESLKHVITFHTKIGDYSLRNPLKEIEKKMPSSRFVRCNNSFLVNLEHVTKVRGTTVVVANKYELQMTRGKKDEFMKAFTLYMGGADFE